MAGILNWLRENWFAIVAWIVPAVVLIWLVEDGAFRKEVGRNDVTPAPEDNQIRWHVQHTREDAMLIVKLLFVIAAILYVILIVLWRQSSSQT